VDWNTGIKAIRRLPLWGLLAIIFVSSNLLVAINYYTLETMSAVRAYINGESNYSKGEKDATQSLISYIQTSDTKYWEDYLTNIQIPQGDSLARGVLQNEENEELARKGFLQGHNHIEDVNEMIWLFRTFKDLPLMAEPIGIWEKGDSLIWEKHKLANTIKAAIEGGTIHENQSYFLDALKLNSYKLTQKEKEFSESLGATARKIRDYLFYTNTFIILLILGSVTYYAYKILKRLEGHNQELTHANEELDRIAYGVSHDLRAPINSMLGLVNLAKAEKNSEMTNTYLGMIKDSLRNQERFIKEMIAISKENKKVLKREIVDLGFLIDQVINLHKHMSGAEEITFSKSVGVHRVFSDSHRLEIILNNLVSNAIKYHDESKSDKYIKIKTYSNQDSICIDVEDNGIGIEGKDKSKIFEMYYMSKDREKGTGLGLFIVKEAMAKIGGEIKVESAKGAGSTFTVILNK
jgi:signal transduction histidine kinase